MLLSRQTYLDGRKEVIPNPVPSKVNWFGLRHFVFLNTLCVGGVGAVRMRVVWRGHCLSLLAPFPLEAVFTVFLAAPLLLIRHAV